MQLTTPLRFSCLLLVLTMAAHGDSARAQEGTPFQATPVPTDMAVSPDGKWLALAGGEMGKVGEVKLWDLATGKERLNLKGHTDMVLGVAFAPNGRTLASAGWDRTVKVWDTATGKERATLVGHTRQIWSVHFSPDGKLLASGSADQTVKLWNVATGQERATFSGQGGSVVVFSPDGRTLAVGGDDGIVKLWDVATGRERATLASHTNRVSGAVFAPDGRTLATASWDTTLSLWDVATGRHKATFTGHKGSLVSVAYSPDGKTLASACTYHQLFRHGGPGGGISKVVDGSEVKVWEVATGQARITFEPDDARYGRSYFLAFSGNGRALITVRGDGLVTQWDLPRLAARPR